MSTCQPFHHGGPVDKASKRQLSNTGMLQGRAGQGRAGQGHLVHPEYCMSEHEVKSCAKERSDGVVAA